MKLKKREITLNEADSLKDVFYLEKMLQREYESAESNAFRKETLNMAKNLSAEAEGEAELLLSLWKKSKAEQL